MPAEPVLEGGSPRVFGLPPGRDLAAELVRGLEARLAGRPPEAWGRVTLLVPTRRLQRRLRDLFDAGPPRLLPRIRLVADLALDPAGADLPPPVPSLRRRLELTRLVAALLDREPDMAPRARAFDLGGSLADLMEEMQGEGVPPAALAALDVDDLSGHWARSLRFLRILEPWFGAEGAPDGEARLRAVVERLAARWEEDPPAGVTIVAGATGARGATMRLMEAVARLPQGAAVLPGFDFDLPGAVWDGLDDPLTGEDHPQFRFAALLRRAGLSPAAVRPWTGAEAPCPPRARLVSLALRPPPVTDQWLTEGPRLGPLRPACDGLTLLEAPSPRLEAEAVALRMRQGIEDGQTCALVTPDRALARAVAAALDRWGVAPDDSAGVPLSLTPPGRLLRQVADLRGSRGDAGAILSLLKHPLCHAGAGRGAHGRRVEALELALRRDGPPCPDAGAVRRFAAQAARTGRGDEGWGRWGEWLADLLDRLRAPAERPLARHVADHLALAEGFAAGSEPDSPSPLWRGPAGREARAACTELARHADAGGTLAPFDYARLLDGVLAGAELRERDRGHPLALVWGPQEARAGGADLVILGGCNEGTWPAAPGPDPWLNRRMRERAGLPVPERLVGEAALDLSLALNAPEAWITRAARSEDAPTVPSRWLNRIETLLAGLPGQGGPEALAGMRARGERWLRRAAALTEVSPEDRKRPAPRPSPRPPVHARPRTLSVRTIERLVRDPYGVYAEQVLRLRPLDALAREPDNLEKGAHLHEVMSRFVPGCDPSAPDARDRLLATAAAVLEEACPWPVMRRVWLAHLERIADAFLAREAERRADATPHLLREAAAVSIERLGVTVTAQADRIDLTPDGRVVLVDYIAGKPPSKPEQREWAKGLLLAAALARQGGFAALGRVEVAGALHVGLGSGAPVAAAPLDEHDPDAVWAELVALLERWQDPARGYSARMNVPRGQDGWDGPYDHLARFGEWDHATEATPLDL